MRGRGEGGSPKAAAAAALRQSDGEEMSSLLLLAEGGGVATSSGVLSPATTALGGARDARPPPPPRIGGGQPHPFSFEAAAPPYLHATNNISTAKASSPPRSALGTLPLSSPPLSPLLGGGDDGLLIGGGSGGGTGSLAAPPPRAALAAAAGPARAPPAPQNFSGISFNANDGMWRPEPAAAAARAVRGTGGAHTGVERVGLRGRWRLVHLDDPFTTLLNMPTGRFLCVFVGASVAFWAAFALPFMLVPEECIPQMRGSFAHSLYFSMQLATTLGWQAPSMDCGWTNVVVVAEVLLSSLLNYALLGVVFSRFSSPAKRALAMRFSAAVAVHRGTAGWSAGGGGNGGGGGGGGGGSGSGVGGAAGGAFGFGGGQAQGATRGGGRGARVGGGGKRPAPAPPPPGPRAGPGQPEQQPDDNHHHEGGNNQDGDHHHEGGNHQDDGDQHQGGSYSSHYSPEQQPDDQDDDDDGRYWRLVLRVASVRKHVLLQPEVECLLAWPCARTRAEWRFQPLALEDEAGSLANLKLGYVATLTHVVRPSSPLWRLSPRRAGAQGLELVVFLSGVDAMTSNATASRAAYRLPHDLALNSRLASVYVVGGGGRHRLDFTGFDSTVPDLLPPAGAVGAGGRGAGGGRAGGGRGGAGGGGAGGGGCGGQQEAVVAALEAMTFEELAGLPRAADGLA